MAGISFTMKQIVAIIIIIIFMIFLGTLFGGTQNKKIEYVDKFIHKRPQDGYGFIVKEIGDPDVIVNKKNGMIIWYNRGIFNTVVLLDEEITHNKLHYDFLYTTINIYIDESMICDMLKISDSVTYDKMKNNLTVRSYFLGGNVAICYLIMLFLDGQTDIKLDENFINKFKNVNFYKKMRYELEKMIKQNHDNYLIK